MKQHIIVFLLLCLAFTAYGARKALVIGNADYTDSPLRNPVNDANLVSEKLRQLGFEVSKVTNANQQRMDEALNNFVAGLTSADEAVFYYSGHGANVQGENFLIPVGKTLNYQEELKYYAFSCNLAMEKLQRARISVIVLDACRDNPFKGVRSGSKGLANMQGKAGSQYIIFATEQGRTAADGSGSTSPFTESFVKNLGEPVPIENMMKKVTSEVKAKTYDQQVPWTSGNLIEDFYFARTSGSVATPATPKQDATEVETIRNYGWIVVSSDQPAAIYLDGSYKGQAQAEADLKINNVSVGSHELKASAAGREEAKNIRVEKDRGASAVFTFIKVPDGFVLVEGSAFQMGSPGGGSDEKPVHSVTVSSFYLGKYEVTQKEWTEVMGSNPSNWKGDNLPMESVSWYDAVEYCNKRSVKEGLTPCYSGSGNNVSCNWSANGYRLPTEAEWEYAARGGSGSKGYNYSGSNDLGSVAWYSENSGTKTHTVGGKAANELGIYDMSGNVWEWCWDWYDAEYYKASPGSDPRGAGSGSSRVLRGGSWCNLADVCRVAYRDMRQSRLQVLRLRVAFSQG